MKAKNLIIHLSFFAGLLFFSPQPFGEESKYSANEVQSRMNQIYYWHLAEELNISSEQEKAMVKILEQAQKDRVEWLNAREEAFKILKTSAESAPGKADVSTLASSLTKYESIGHHLDQVDSREFTALRKLFGDQTLARFLVVRDSITERLRNSLRKSPITQSSR